jgi:hypothetical protein
MLAKNGITNLNHKNGQLTKQTLSVDSETVNEGYYDATTLSTIDSDLAEGNIKSGTTIFGILGTYSP